MIPIIEECRAKITEFLQGRERNTYLYIDGIASVYVRKGHHLIEKNMLSTFDIGSINVYEPGQGTGTIIIELIHEMNPYDVTFIESLLNTRLHSRLLLSGWKNVAGSNPPCVYKRTQND